MANTISSNLIPSIIGAGREALSENMSYLGIVNKNYQDAQAKVGQSVDIAIPAVLSAESVTAANIAPAPSAITNGVTTLTLDKFYKTSFAISATDKMNYDIESYIMEQMKEAVRGVAKQLNSDLIGEAYTGVPYAVGNAGTGFFASNYDGLLDARKALLGRNVDMSRLAGIFSLKDTADLGKIDQVQNANQFGDRSLNMLGMVSRVAGFDILEDQQATAHVKGTITAGTLGAATTGVNTTTVTCATGEGCALKAGDLIAVDGATYSVQSDLTVAASASGTLTVDRNWETALDGDEALAFATASDGDGGVFDANSLRNIVGDFSGLSAVLRRPASEFLGGQTQGDHFPIVDEKSGAVLNMAIYQQYHQIAFEVSSVAGFKTTDNRKLCKVLSYSS
jgi:hypothetical protein